jgi:hypothetical protein
MKARSCVGGCCRRGVNALEPLRSTAVALVAAAAARLERAPGLPVVSPTCAPFETVPAPRSRQLLARRYLASDRAGLVGAVGGVIGRPGCGR